MSRRSEFPAWAPPSLVAEYADLRGNLASLGDMRAKMAAALEGGTRAWLFAHTTETAARMVEVYRRLLTDLNMGDVWQKLLITEAATFGAARSRPTTEDPACMLARECILALDSWDDIPHLTPSEMQEAYQEITPAISALRKALAVVDDHRLDAAPFRAIDRRKLKRLSRYIAMYPSRPPSTSDNEEEFCSFMSRHVPTTEAVLSSLEILIDRCSAKPLVVLKQAHSRKAGTHYFVGELSRYFEHWYGQRFHETVATLASVVLGVEVSEAAVRLRINYEGKPARKKRSEKHSACDD